MGVELSTPDLRSTLAAAKEFSPKLARGLRKELRSVGDDIIAKQRAVLSGPLPSGVEKTGQRTRMVLNKKTGSIVLAKRNVYRDKAVRRKGGTTEMREQIKAGLKTRVVAGKTRQGVSVRTTRSQAPLSIIWQSKRFRHKAWGRLPYIDQKGQPYYWEPVLEGRDAARKKAGDAIDAALSEMRKK